MQVDRKLWPVVVIRIFAVTNLLMGFVGLVALWGSLRTTLHFDPWPQDPPFYAQAYYIRSGINVVFVVLTLVAAVYLWRVHPRAWALCKVLFVGEIAYFFLDWFDFPLLLAFGDRAPLVARALAASEGTGNMGTVFQTLTGYPVIALIALKIAFGKLRRLSGSRTPAAAPPPRG